MARLPRSSSTMKLPKFFSHVRLALPRRECAAGVPRTVAARVSLTCGCCAVVLHRARKEVCPEHDCENPLAGGPDRP